MVPQKFLQPEAVQHSKIWDMRSMPFFWKMWGKLDQRQINFKKRHKRKQTWKLIVLKLSMPLYILEKYSHAQGCVYFSVISLYKHY